MRPGTSFNDLRNLTDDVRSLLANLPDLVAEVPGLHLTSIRWPGPRIRGAADDFDGSGQEG